jgi:VWFA-related protein
VPRPKALTAAALGILAALRTAPAAGQAPSNPAPAQQVFRSGAQLVVETVTVKDKDGRAVEGLTAKDFTVTEDGALQTISFVEFQHVESAPGAPAQVAPPAGQPPPSPLAAPAPSAGPAAPPPVAYQIAAPPPGDTRYRDRRLIVLYFDLTAMPPPDLTRAYAAARKFIAQQIQPQDLVAIMTFQGGAVKVKHDFTADRGELEEVFLRLIYGDDLDGDGIPDVTPDTGTAFGQDDAEFNILDTDRQLSALQTAATMLRPLPEQKSLVYFASGLRLNGVDNQAQLRATTNAAIRANVAIFPVDARGLVAQAPLGDATVASPGGIGVFSGQLADTRQTNFQRSQDTLYSLAKDTGGKALFDNNDLSLGIVQAAQAVGSYYIIGFYTTHPARDGRFHRVHVALTGGLAADLSYRQGYFADKEFGKFTAADKERQLEEALMLDNPVTDLTIAMEVNYFQLDRAQYFVPVAVKIPGSELALAQRRGAARTVIDFIGEVKDDYGITVQNVRDRLDIKLSGETAAQLVSRPIQYQTGFTLLPGKYVIKFLARDAETGRIGTYQAAFTIPNLNRELTRVPISSVVLSSQRVALTGPGGALYSVKKGSAPSVDPLVSDGSQLIPSVTRVFSTRRDLYVFLQAYERTAPAMPPLVAFVSFYRGDVKAFETAPLAVTGSLDPTTKAVPLRFSLSLSGLPPGRYACQVTVLNPGAQKAAFWRADIVLVP